ncbi:hypothetical protein HNO89_002052 [Sporosarcina luteola]|nr:hypothetical protein [Sporosarcina luteola]
MRVFVMLLLGAVVGFFGMYAALSFNVIINFNSIAFAITLTLIAINVLLVGFVMVSKRQMNHMGNLVLSGEEEDMRDVWQYKRYSDMTLCSTASFLIGIGAVAISIITGQAIWLTIASSVITSIAALLSVVVSSSITKLYPERSLPSVSEKDYANKFLAASDEGERYVMLQGLYRAFTTMNNALIIALLLFIIYSVSTGDSQLFAIFVIVLVLIGANARYHLFIRKKT